MSKLLKKHGYTILLGLVILLGVLLRLKCLLANPSLWHDECALAWNVKFKNYGDFFGILRFLQVVPPLFLVATKLVTKIFGFSEISLRLLPFLTGVGSLIAFYFLAVKTIKNKVVALWAVFFLAINQPLINYSYEFRSYGLDAFFAIILLLFFINLNLEKLSVKKSVLYGTLISIIPWFSFTSVFIIAGGCINMFFKIIKAKNKNLYFPFSIFHFPLIISGLIYLKTFLLNNYTGTHMASDWQSSFLSFNPLFSLSLLVDNLRYFFFPIPFVLLALILLLWGIGIFYREKSSFFEVCALSFIIFVVASLLHIYPFSSRLILFMIPIFLLFMIKPLDIVTVDKKNYFFLILVITFFTFYPQVIRINHFIHAKDFSRGEHPREMMEFMIKNMKPKDIIFVNNLSNTEFAYYSSFHNLKNKVIQEPQKINHTEFLNSLEKKKYYWFYLTFGNSQTIMDWIKRNAEVITIVSSNYFDRLIYVYVK